MSAPTPTDFPAPEGYYTPEAGGLLFSLSPMMTATLILLLGLALLLGWLWGRSKRPGDDPSEAIYTAIRKALAEATGAPRDSVISAARKAQTVIKDQLGDVLVLAKGLAGPYGALGPALDGVDKSPHKGDHKPDHKPETHAEKSGVEKVIIKARDVFISHAPASDSHDDDHGKDGHGNGHGKDDKGHGDKPAPGGRGGHGGDHPPKTLSASAQIEAVRAAIHNLSDHWSDKGARIKELQAARKQLTRVS
ncbi:hypothetical protein [Brevundimonas goettingensis]|uniref:Uncharacterized protein n=1 Tax=Brevundimonas goettingensis TaxID=2774190 RepID=A0A975BZ98_9CAUL|nr:hypothetical protein [Brevundimonas goettingensis]QTC90583.1 hypothetical protein IFJ75_15105 [Brevundimonas goettingensis]